MPLSKQFTLVRGAEYTFFFGGAGILLPLSSLEGRLVTQALPEIQAVELVRSAALELAVKFEFWGAELRVTELGDVLGRILSRGIGDVHFLRAEAGDRVDEAFGALAPGEQFLNVLGEKFGSPALNVLIVAALIFAVVAALRWIPRAQG